MNCHYLILSSFYILLLAGCATESDRHPLFVSETVQDESSIQSGKHKKAADLYQTLAKSESARQNQLKLLMAEEYIQSGASLLAQSLADTINPASFSAEQRNRLNLLNAQISLSNGEAEQALSHFNMTQVHYLDARHQIIYYQSLAFAHSLAGNLLQSTQARIQLNPLLSNDQQRYENNIVILNTLNLLPIQSLILKQPPAPNILGGWMSLTRLLKEARLKQNPTGLQINLTEWQRIFPQHPANSGFLQSYLQGSKHSFKLPSAIALLLPESGSFAQAAHVIKVGFMVAYNNSRPTFQPPIRFYDSTSGSVVSLYHQAISEGAELIIGPLGKVNIKTLALGTELTTPVLALNHILNVNKNNLFQLGLSPIDEAKQLTVKASQDGHRKVLVLTPETKKGQRIANHLTEYWYKTAGTVLETRSYNPKTNDFSNAIKDLLNLDESRNRYNKLKRFLASNIHYIERRRQDVDAIFLSAKPHIARSLYPQLRFYRAPHISIYATPEIYSGQPEPSLDLDLNNINFCGIPWLLIGTRQGNIGPELLSNIWQQLPNRYLRLIALGIDAFNIISQLDHLDTISYSGATGTLSLNSEQRITRQLVCAKFIKGEVVLQNRINEENNEIFDNQDMIGSEGLVQ